MINLKKIKQIAKERNLSLKELSNEIGITEQGLQNLMSKNTCNLSTLQKIAEALDVSEVVFFDQYTPYHTNNVSINTGINGSPNAILSNGTNSLEVELLRERISGLELLNQSYKDQIELLKNQLATTKHNQ